jgi:hypothetical protein
MRVYLESWLLLRDGKEIESVESFTLNRQSLQGKAWRSCKFTVGQSFDGDESFSQN